MKRNYIVKTSPALRPILLLLTVVFIGACQPKKHNETHEEKIHQTQAENAHAAKNHPTEDIHADAHADEAIHAQTDTSLNYLIKPVNEHVITPIPVIRASKGPAVYIREISGRIAYDTRNQVSLSSRVTGRIEKLYVKYNYQPVKKGQLILTLYSPDLAAAQRELLLIKRSGSSITTASVADATAATVVAAGRQSGQFRQEDSQLLNAAKQKLMLLGMSATQVNRVIRTGQISYSIPVYSNASGYILEQQSIGGVNPVPSSSSANPVSSSMDNMGSGGNGGNNNTDNSAKASSSIAKPVMLREGQYLNAGQRIFTIYQSSALVAEFFLPPAEAANVSKHAKVIIQHTGSSKETLTGKIGLIQPVINAGENFVLVRVYLDQKGLQVGELVTGQVPFITETAYWLPKEAVLSLGNKSVVFRKNGKSFIPLPVKTGITQNNQVQILEDIRDWDIAKNSWYLVDSESFIKIKNKD